MAIGQTQAQTSRFGRQQYLDAQGDTLRYRLLTPDYGAASTRTYPLVIFLHGSGERGSDNEAQLQWGVAELATDHHLKTYPAFVLAPQCPAGLNWSNFAYQGDKFTLLPNPSKPMAQLMALIDQLTAELPIDTQRIYLTGLSMGGFGVFDALARYPQRFAAAAPVCGGGDPATAAAFAHLPVWIFTGAEDRVVDPQLSRLMLEALIKAGAQPGYTQYPGVGHFSWLAAYSDPMLWPWLFAQRR